VPGAACRVPGAVVPWCLVPHVRSTSSRHFGTAARGTRHPAPFKRHSFVTLEVT